MARKPISFQSYIARAKPGSASRLVNLYAEPLPKGAKFPLSLNGTPGLRSFATAGTGPIRAALEWKGAAYVVSGQGLYKIASDGTATQIGGLILPSAGNVFIDANQVQIGICVPPNFYFSDGLTLTQVVDADLPEVSSFTMVDNYGVLAQKDTGTFWLTELVDFSQVDGLDFASAEGFPDNLVRVFADHRTLWLFGTKSIELWYDSGNADLPFDRLAGGFIERGLAGPMAVCKGALNIYWLGDDKQIYMAQGIRPTRISTFAVEEALRGYPTVTDCIAFAYSQGGHDFMVFKFPGAGATWVYDASTKLWHERESQQYTAFRWSCTVAAYEKVLAGDALTNELFEVDLDTYTEDGIAIVRIADTAPIYNNGHQLTIDALQLEFQTGVGLNTGQGSDPQVVVQISRDGGQTFEDERWFALGAIGEYRTRVVTRQWGSVREAMFRVKVSDPVKVAALGARIEARPGAH